MHRFLFCLLLLGLPFSAPAKSYQKLFEKARKDYSDGTFTNAPENPERLRDAHEAIEKAIETQEGQSNPRAWILRGAVYQAIATFDPRYQKGNAATLRHIVDSKTRATESILEALKLLEQPNAPDLDYGDCSALAKFCDTFLYPANEAYKAEDLYKALEFYRPVIAIVVACRKAEFTRHSFYWYGTTLRRAYDAASRLGLPDEAERYVYLAYQGKAFPEAFHELYVRSHNANDLDQAVAYLEEGMAAFPDDIGLLTDSIDHDFRHERFAPALIEKLDRATSLEPGEIAHRVKKLWASMQLCVRAEDGATARQYYSVGLATLKKLREEDPDNPDNHVYEAQLHRLIRFQLIDEQSKLGEEASSTRQALEEQVVLLAEQAISALRNAEQAAPSHQGCLALLELIYRQDGDEELADVFAERLATVQAGGQIVHSYFASQAALR